MLMKIISILALGIGLAYNSYSQVVYSDTGRLSGKVYTIYDTVKGNGEWGINIVYNKSRLDTINAVILISEKPTGQVFIVDGYEVISVRYNDVWTAASEHICWLDKNKKPFPNTITVWLSKLN